MHAGAINMKKLQTRDLSLTNKSKTVGDLKTHSVGKPSPSRGVPTKRGKKQPKSVPRAPSGSKLDSPIHRFLNKVKAEGLLCEVKEHKKFDSKTHHKGSVRVCDQIYESADTSVASSFVNLNTVYRFRLGGHTTIGYSSGTLDEYFACDPSASGLGFPEWTTLTSLFSEFRLVSLTIQFVRQRQSGTDYNTQFNNPIMIAGNLGTAAAPGSYSNLADNADSRMWNCANSTSDHGYTHSLHGRGLNWSEVATPTVEPYAGAPGSIQLFGTASSGVPNDCIHCLVVGIYDFRSRV